MKLNETLLLAGAAGALLIWILEFRRTNFADSYLYLMLFVGLLFAFQYVRNKRLEQEKAVSPTVKKKKKSGSK